MIAALREFFVFNLYTILSHGQQLVVLLCVYPFWRCQSAILSPWWRFPVRRHENLCILYSFQVQKMINNYRSYRQNIRNGSLDGAAAEIYESLPSEMEPMATTAKSFLGDLATEASTTPCVAVFHRCTGRFVSSPFVYGCIPKETMCRRAIPTAAACVIIHKERRSSFGDRHHFDRFPGATRQHSNAARDVWASCGDTKLLDPYGSQ
jgi:hypothetical protein